jgi:Uma2 family endonuclease
MGEAAQPRPLSLEAYLEWEAQSPERHELVEGITYAMAGASKAHNLLVQNLAFLLRAPARAKGCRLYTETVKLKVSQSTLYYPDLMVVCGPFSPTLFTRKPPAWWPRWFLRERSAWTGEKSGSPTWACPL